MQKHVFPHLYTVHWHYTWPPLGHVKECSLRLGMYCLRGEIDFNTVKQLLFLYKNNLKLYNLSVIPTGT